MLYGLLSPLSIVAVLGFTAPATPDTGPPFTRAQSTPIALTETVRVNPMEAWERYA